MNLNIFKKMSRGQTNRTVNEINNILDEERKYTNAQTALATMYINEVTQSFGESFTITDNLTQNNLLLMAAISQLMRLDIWVPTYKRWYSNGRGYSYYMKRIWRAISL